MFSPDNYGKLTFSFFVVSAICLAHHNHTYAQDGDRVAYQGGSKIHVRRTDKVGTEAAYHGIKEYMKYVEEYYDRLIAQQGDVVKRVYLASDDPKVLTDARQLMNELTNPDVVKELKSSWQVLGAEMKKNGLELLTLLLEMHPDTKSKFAHLGDVSAGNSKMTAHGITIMYRLGSFIDQLDDPEVLAGMMQKNGASHLKISVTGEQFGLVTDPLLVLLEKKLGDKFTDNTKSSWKKFINAIVAGFDG